MDIYALDYNSALAIESSFCMYILVLSYFMVLRDA